MEGNLLNGDCYLQVQGVAKGTCCAPSYTNLHLGSWERELFDDKSSEIYLCYVLTWHRYIDDVLLVWDEKVELLEQFFKVLTTNTCVQFPSWRSLSPMMKTAAFFHHYTGRKLPAILY